MPKVVIFADEWYPCYCINDADSYDEDYERVVEIPDDLYNEHKKAEAAFVSIQSKLEQYYIPPKWRD